MSIAFLYLQIKLFYFIFKMIARLPGLRLFKSAQMQGVQEAGREAYAVIR